MSKLPPRKRNRDEEVISLRNFAREQGDLAQSCMNAKFKFEMENRQLKNQTDLLYTKIRFQKEVIKSLLNAISFLEKTDAQI